MIEELCEKLKEKRKQLYLTIEEVVEQTKLHPSVIKDIEDCNLDNISSTYLRGFIKIYASFLGVEIGSALEELASKPHIRSSTKPAKDKTVKKESKIKTLIEKTVSFLKSIKFKFSPKTKTIIVFSILAIVAFMIFASIVRFVVAKISNRIKEPPKVEEKVVVPKDTIVYNKDRIAVSLTTKRKCFLRVKVDGALLFEGILTKGNVESWEAKKEIEFRISDGSAVYLEINGKPLPPLTSMHRPIKSLKITPSGISVDK